MFRRHIDRLFTLPQYVVPQRLLSRLVRRITRIEAEWFKNLAIRLFINRFDVDMTVAEREDPEDYKSFNDFFTRALRADARNLKPSESTIISPADGVISQIGAIDNYAVLQAKDRYFSASALIGVSAASLSEFDNGRFATIYLSPRDYHRVHVPCDGRILGLRYIPGDLFSVNERTARVVDNLFARNERIVVELDTSFGAMTVVMVGAMLVSSMTVCCYDIDEWLGDEWRHRTTLSHDFDAPGIPVSAGDELGRFNMGSTVIIIAGPQVAWNDGLGARSPVVAGDVLGERASRNTES